MKQTVCAVIDITGKINESILDGIKAIDLSGQRHGAVSFDSNNEVFSHLIKWQVDRYSKPFDEYDGETIIQVMGEIIRFEGFEELGIDSIPSGFMGSAIFYLKENNSELFNNRHVILPTNF